MENSRNLHLNCVIMYHKCLISNLSYFLCTEILAVIGDSSWKSGDRIVVSPAEQRKLVLNSFLSY